MRRVVLWASLAAMLLVLIGRNTESAEPKLPMVGGKPVLAVINGEPLTLEEFDRLLAGIHEGTTDNAARPRSNPSELLDRLINAKLVLQEARNIGLDSLPEVQSALNTYEEDTLRGMLFADRVRNVKKADQKEIEKRYREAVKEYKLKSLLFDKEVDVKRLQMEIGEGKDFDDAANRMIAARGAKGDVEGRYLKSESLNPAVAAALSSMKEGEVSPPVPIGGQFTVVKLEGIRFPENPAAREKAEKDALQAKRIEALKSYTEGLKKKYAKVDGKLLEDLDFESPEPGFEKLLADKRVLADFKGGKSVTVGDLAIALQKKFFHGTERAAQEKKINKRKAQVLDDIVARRVVNTEAKRKKLDRTDYFKNRVGEYRNGILFGVFVQKAIDPDVKVTEPEMKAYLQEHIREYTNPEMIRIDGIAFATKKDAEDVLEKLRKGAEFQWAKANAEGRLEAKEGGNVYAFGGNLLLSTELPEIVRKAVTGAAAGDYRICGETDAPYYVLHVKEVIPSGPQPFEVVKDQVERKVFQEKRQKALREWEEKLRKASTVKIYASGAKLDRIVKPHGR